MARRNPWGGLLAFPLVGCFFANIDNAQFTCEDDGESCPRGQVCLDGAVCVDAGGLVPSVDPVARVTPFDRVLITGKSLRGATVRVLSGGEVIGEALVDPDPDADEIVGDFVVFAELAPGAQRLLVEAELAGVVERSRFDNQENRLEVEFDAGAPLFLEDAAGRGLGFTVPARGEALDNQGATFQDLDLDGDLDLVIGSDPGGGVRLNNGRGSFTQGPQLATDIAAAFGDFDEDGDLDAATSSSGGIARAFPGLLADQGALVFGGAANFSNAENSEGVSLVDANGGGFLDIVFQDGGENRFEPNLDGVFGPEDANLLLAAKQSGEDATGNGSFSAAGDFDADGLVDVATNDRPNHQLFLATAPDVFVAIAGEFFDDVANQQRALGFADVLGGDDGRLELFAALGAGGLALIPLVRAGDDVNPGAAVLLGGGAVDGVAAGDFDLDGDLDFLASGDDGADRLYLNAGGLQGGDLGDFIDASDFLAAADDGEGVAAGDVDLDGDLDAFVVDQAGASRLYLNALGDIHVRTLRVVRLSGGVEVDVVGAVVRLFENTADGPRFFAARQVDGGSGHGGQDPLALHFGGAAPLRRYLATISIPGCQPIDVILEPDQDAFSFSGACP